MSTSVKSFFILFAVVFFVAISARSLFAQDLEINIAVEKDNPKLVKISGKLLKDNVLRSRNWVFLKSHFGFDDLAKRVKKFDLFDSDGKEISVKKFADGEFLSEEEAKSFYYEVDLAVLKNENSMAHVSWIEGSNGLIMLYDLLPQFGKSKPIARVVFTVPKRWKISQNEKFSSDRQYFVKDLDSAVFLIGDQWRSMGTKKDSEAASVFALGGWQFSDSEAIAMTESIVSEYEKLFGTSVPEQTSIFLLPFANVKQTGRWRAETRGKNITIVSSPMPFKNQAVQRLHEQLRHEIFHLWIPNRLNLSGNYAWFYEGFAVYQALKTGVWLGQIRFEDFLSTLGRAYDIHVRSSNDVAFISLANKPPNSVSASVYSKGMLIAFLTDIAILRKTRGKKDISTIFKSLPFRDVSGALALSANDLILDRFTNRAELKGIADKYLKGSAKIRWRDYLYSIGVEDVGKISFARLKVRPKLNRTQKALLKKLGYNRWRKLVTRSR